MSLYTKIPITPDVNKLYNIDYKKLQESGVKLQKQKFEVFVPIKYKEKIKALNKILDIFKNYIEIKIRDNKYPKVYPMYTYIEFELYFENAMDDIYNSFLNCIEPVAKYIVNDDNRVDFLAKVTIKAWKKIGRYEDLIKMCKAKDAVLNKRILELDFESKQEAEKKKTQAYNRKLKFREGKTRIDLELNSKDLEMFQNIKEKEYLRSNIDVLRYLMNLYENSTEISEDSELEIFETFYKLYLEAADKLNLYAKYCNRGEKDKIPTTGMHTIKDLVSTANETIGRIKNLHKTFMQAELKKVVKIDNINKTYRSNITQLESNEIDTLDIVNIFTSISNMTEPHTKNR